MSHGRPTGVRRAALALMVGLVTTVVGHAFGAREEQASVPRDGAQVTVEGTVRRVGSEPFSELVIVDDEDGVWHVRPEDEPTLAMREQTRVRVRAVVRIVPQVRADGAELPPRRELTEVELVSP